MFVGGREPVLDPSLSEVADGEPLTDAIKDQGKKEENFLLSEN